MAQEQNALNKVQAWCLKSKENLENIGVTCLLVLFIPIVFVGVVLDWIFVHNWIMFPIWALLCPRFAAKSLIYDSELLEDYDQFCRRTLQREINLLPRYVKNAFIEEGVGKFSDSDFLEYFRRAKDQENAWKILQRNGRGSLLWKGDDSEQSFFLMHADSLSVEHLIVAFGRGMSDVLERYLTRGTFPSAFVDYLIQHGNEGNARGYLREHVKKHGLTADQITQALSTTINVDQWLASYGQRNLVMTCSGESPLWQKYCRSDAVFFPENEKLMSRKHLEVFYQSGRFLSEEGIVHHLGNFKRSPFIASLIIQTEKPEKLMNNCRIKALIQSNAELLSEFYMAH